MQFDGVINYMKKHKLDWQPGPRVSYHYSKAGNQLTIYTPRGKMTYSKELLDEPLYRDTLNYLLRGAASEELKRFTGIEKPFIEGYDKITEKRPEDFEYIIMKVKGKKRTAYIVKPPERQVFEAVIGPLKIEVYGGSLTAYWNGNMIFFGKATQENLQLAVDMEKQKLIKKMIPPLDERHIVNAVFRNTLPLAGILRYETDLKRVRTSLHFDRKKQEFIFENVVYREGVYRIRVPADYTGPDPLAPYSMKELPKEVKKYRNTKFPVKIKKKIKLINNEMVPGIIAGKYTIFFSEYSGVSVYQDGKEVKKSSLEEIETILSLADPDQIETILEML